MCVNATDECNVQRRCSVLRLPSMNFSIRKTSLWNTQANKTKQIIQQKQKVPATCKKNAIMTIERGGTFYIFFHDSWTPPAAELRPRVNVPFPKKDRRKGKRVQARMNKQGACLDEWTSNAQATTINPFSSWNEKLKLSVKLIFSKKRFHSKLRMVPSQ